METQTLTVIDHNEFGLEEKQAKDIQSGLAQVLAERNVFAEQYALIIKEELNEDTIDDLVDRAKELHGKILKNRTKGIDAWHTTEKAFYLAGGRFVDAIKNKYRPENLRMEEQLMEIVKYKENLEKKRLDELRASRLERIMPFLENEPPSIELMDEDVFKNFLIGSEMAFKQREQQNAALELAEKENARLDSLEQERKIEIAPYVEFVDETKSIDLRTSSDEAYATFLNGLKDAKAKVEVENERIRKENEALAKKNAEIEAKAKSERDKLQAELKAKQDAENQRIAENNAKILAEKKAQELELKKGDSEKFEDLTKDLVNLTTKYQFTSQDGKHLYSEVVTLLEKTINHIKTKK